MPRLLSKPRRQSRLFLSLLGCSRRSPAYVGSLMPAPAHKGLRAIAVFEAFKGALILAGGFGLLSFLGRDNEVFAERIIRTLHLNPAHHYPQIFITAMAETADSRLMLFAGFAAIYAGVRFAEAYGLWHARRWAEWFAALSGAVYIPVELYELAQRITWLRITALVVNVIVVGYMVWLLTENQRKRTAAEKKLTEAGP